MSSTLGSFGRKVPIWKRKRAHQSDEMALQITSMADIFTILLVFLLKSYSSSSMAIQPAAGTQLPSGHPAEASIEALKVEITEGSILVEGASVATLNGFALSDAGASGVSQGLSAALEKERKRQLLIAQSNSDVKVDPKIIVVADQRAPYATIKGVLASAALHGYTDFKLAVAKED